MTLNGNAPGGYIQVNGSNASFRLDHLTISDISGERGIEIGNASMNGYGQPADSTALKGLIDHITMTDDSSKILIALYGYSVLFQTVQEKKGVSLRRLSPGADPQFC
jgi:hypothetical protein